MTYDVNIMLCTAYGRQTRLGFVIVNFFLPNISIRCVIDGILHLRQPVR